MEYPDCTISDEHLEAKNVKPLQFLKTEVDPKPPDFRLPVRAEAAQEAWHLAGLFKNLHLHVLRVFRLVFYGF